MFFGISDKPIKIQTLSAPQNDRLNLLFMEDIHVDGEKMARKGRKIVIYESQILRNSLYVLVYSFENSNPFFLASRSIGHHEKIRTWKKCSDKS